SQEGEAPALPGPGPGELFLGYFPGDRGWIAFAATANSLRAVALAALEPGLDAAALGRRLLDPFGAEVAQARRIRMLAYGAAERLDLHALTWQGRPLIE